jgi:transglutaminase-like putative cysteine protease
MASLLPGVVLLTLLIGSTERRLDSLWALVMIMLLLMGIGNYKNHVQHWESNHFDYSDSIRLDMGQYLLIMLVVVGLISYITPSISWRDIRDHFRERERSNQTEVVTNPSNNGNAGPHIGKVPGSSLPREHLLTAGFAQSKDIVMTIKTGELSPVPMQTPAIYVPRYYWRSVIYDRYDGRGWISTSAASQPVSANHPLIAGVLSNYKLLHLSVQMQQPEGKLYWTGVLYSADVPLAVDWRLRPQSSLFADQTTLLQADMFAARTDASAYRADAFVPIPSIEQLRAAPDEEYPAHIRNLYFSLPATVPERVHRLAREITQGQMTVYDKAKAIETYLRSNYPYDLEILAPPADQDVADYFLFDLKRGYCDYYATAMVVLARSNGLPARFVSGYASGDYDMANAEYTVRELHAHSWAEVYFPEIGWIEFEPTGNQPEIERQLSNLHASEADESKSIIPNFYFEWRGWKISALFIPLVLLLFALRIYFGVIEPLFFARMAPVAAIEILYQRLYRSARPLAGKRTRAETAYEFTNKVIRNIQLINLAFPRPQQMLKEDVNKLAAIYQTALFSDHDIDDRDVKHALNIWKRLRWSLMVERTRYFFWLRNKINR